MLTYNNKNEHNSIEMTPAEARKDDKQLDVKLNLEMKAKKDRKYPEIKIHDQVKIMLKYNKMRKEHNPLYSDMKYEIEKILSQNIKLLITLFTGVFIGVFLLGDYVLLYIVGEKYILDSNLMFLILLSNSLSFYLSRKKFII